MSIIITVNCPYDGNLVKVALNYPNANIISVVPVTQPGRHSWTGRIRYQEVRCPYCHRIFWLRIELESKEDFAEKIFKLLFGPRPPPSRMHQG